MVITASLSCIAQERARTMAGQYLWLDTNYSKTLPMIDTSLVNYQPNIFMSVDSAGSSVTGYYTLTPMTVSDAGLKGAGILNEVTIFGGVDSVFSVSGYKIDTLSTSLLLRNDAINASPNINIRNNDTTAVYRKDRIEYLAGLNFQTIEFKTGGGVEVSLAEASPRLIIDPNQNLFLNEADTNLTIRVDSGFVGIKSGNPQYPIDMRAKGNTFMRLNSPSIETGGASTATFSNAPAGGNPIYYLKIAITISGVTTEGVIPVLRLP